VVAPSPRCAALTESHQRPREVGDALLIGVAVLHDQRRNLLRPPRGEAKSDRRAVILDVEAVATERQDVDEALDDVREAISGSPGPAGG
jgi:hypothetical protein